MTLEDALINKFDSPFRGDGVLFEAKKRAFEKFKASGFPTTKNEEWKYTNISPYLKHDYCLNQPQKSTEINVSEYFLSQNDSEKIVLENGNLISFPVISGVEILSFEDAQKKHPQLIEKTLTKINYDEEFININTALAEKGFFIYVKKGVQIKKPIEILSVQNKNVASFYQLNNIIILESGSEIKLVEQIKTTSDNLSFINNVTRLSIAENSFLELVKIQNNNSESVLVDSVNTVQQNNSTCEVNTLLFGGKFIRNNLSFLQEGENCQSNMSGVVLINENQFADNHTFVDHKSPNCQSNELYKGVYLDNAKGVFNGKILVRKNAQKIDAFQANNNLVVSNNASIDSKPQLEIFADDVKCSHGCTIGQVDEDALFYMQTRGFSKKEAKALLTYAFTIDALEKISIPFVQDFGKKIFAEKLKTSIQFDDLC